MADPEKKIEEKQQEEQKTASKKEEVGNKEILKVLKSVNENLQQLSKREQIEDDAEKSVKIQEQSIEEIRATIEEERSKYEVSFEESFNSFEHCLKNKRFSEYEIKELAYSENVPFMYNFMKIAYLDGAKELETMFEDKNGTLSKDFHLWDFTQVAFKKNKLAPTKSRY